MISSTDRYRLIPYFVPHCSKLFGIYDARPEDHFDASIDDLLSMIRVIFQSDSGYPPLVMIRGDKMFIEDVGLFAERVEDEQHEI